MELGKPDAGKPPVRFDEGREPGGHWGANPAVRRLLLLYTVMEAGSEILKVDEVGRVRMPLEKREAMLAEYDGSGMTGAQFARFVG